MASHLIRGWRERRTEAPWRRRLAAGTTATWLSALPAAHAQTAGEAALQRMNAIEGRIRAVQQEMRAQIKPLEDELRAMRRDLAAHAGQPRAARRSAGLPVASAASADRPAEPTGQRGSEASAPASAPSPRPAAQAGMDTRNRDAGQQAASTTPQPTRRGTIELGGVSVSLGGFVEADGIFRTRNEVADISSSFNAGIPFPQSPQFHENEFRGSARNSRISLLLDGPIDRDREVAAYFETDFQSAAPTANSVESNSYNLRLRQGYLSYEDRAWGLHLLGGQTWSLVTPQRVGITPRQEDLTLAIDGQYVVGFNWARQPQLRIVGDFLDRRLWAGVSLESPQALFAVGPNGAGTAAGTLNFANPGVTGFAPTVSYSDDIAPDTVAKVAWDSGFGHYEAYGLLRFLHDRTSVVGGGRSRTVLAGGGGAAANIPLIGRTLEFHGDLLAGYGIGRYGSAQLPDATVSPSGAPAPLPGIHAMAGLVGHPVPSVDLYAYGGIEQVGRRSFAQGGKGFGYGSPLYVNTGCGVELSPAPCQANTSRVVEGTLGAWWRFLQGSFGTLQAGAQYEYLRRSIFPGVGGSKGTDDSIVLVSVRYLPFQ